MLSLFALLNNEDVNVSSQLFINPIMILLYASILDHPTTSLSLPVFSTNDFSSCRKVLQCLSSHYVTK